VTGDIRGEIAIAINSEVTENGLLEPVPEDAENYLVPAIAGGWRSCSATRRCSSTSRAYRTRCRPASSRGGC
jgi:hypothetical protein